MKTSQQLKSAIDYGCTILPNTMKPSWTMTMMAYLPKDTSLDDLSDLAMETLGPVINSLDEGRVANIMGQHHGKPEDFSRFQVLEAVSEFLTAYNDDVVARIPIVLGNLAALSWLLDLQDFETGADVMETLVDALERGLKDRQYLILVAAAAVSVVEGREMQPDTMDFVNKLRAVVKKERNK